MIKTTGITKSYGDLKVLKGIDIEIKDREVVSIVGASGAGKTTLLQIIGTLDKPDSGIVSYNGTDTSTLRGKALSSFRNTHIGFVFQFHQLLPEFTALENVCIPAYIAGKGKNEAESRAKELLGFLSLSDRLEHKPSELSGGEQQRAALAKVLLLEPKILLLDEPTKGIDNFFKIKLSGILKNLTLKGVTVVMVSHDIEFCAKYADYCAMVFDGSIVSSGTPHELFAGNSFYTTAANRISRHRFPEAVINEDVICQCNQILNQTKNYANGQWFLRF